MGKRNGERKMSRKNPSPPRHSHSAIGNENREILRTEVKLSLLDHLAYLMRAKLKRKESSE